MRGAKQLALIAVLCWLGLAQGYIRWAPRTCVHSLEGAPNPDQMTSANNTWSMTGKGQTVNGADMAVAYVGWVAKTGGGNRKAIFCTHTINGGSIWSTPVLIDDPLADSSGCPTLVRCRESGDLIAAAFVSWYTVDNTVVGRVYVRGSTDMGQYWQPPVQATGPDDRPHACHVSATLSPTNENDIRILDVVWEHEKLVGGVVVDESIYCRPFHAHGDGTFTPLNSDSYSIIDPNLPPDDKPHAPSIYITVPYHNAGCAWVQGTAPDDAVWSNWNQGLNLDWHDTPVVIPSPPNEPAYNHGFPSIACLDSASNFETNDKVSHEMVACDATRDPNSNAPGLVLSWRDWHWVEGHWVPEEWYSEWYYPWDVAPYQMLRPNLYANNRLDRPSSNPFCDTFYMTFTVKANSSADPGNVYYTSFYPVRTQSSWHWGSDDPRELGISGDSATICVFGDKAYASYKSRRPGVAHDSIAVRAGTVVYGVLPVSPEEMLAGSNCQYRLARSPASNVLHRVFAVDSFVSYERSSDNGATWDYQDAPDFGTSPSIALCNGNPTIAYLRNDSVLAATLNSDSEWTIRTLFAGTSTSVPGTPSLAMYSSGARRGNVCFPLYDATSDLARIVYVQFDTSYHLEQDVVDTYTNSFADSACCLAVSTDTAEVVYQHGDSVCMRRLVYSPDAYGSPPDTWPELSLVSTVPAAVARHPYCEKFNSRLWVVYSDYQQGNWVIKRTSCDDSKSSITWEGTTSMCNGSTDPKDFPCMGKFNSEVHHSGQQEGRSYPEWLWTTDIITCHFASALRSWPGVSVAGPCLRSLGC